MVLINNLGGLSQLEQWLVAGEVQKQLADAEVVVERMYAAPLFTSINMPGVQVGVNFMHKKKFYFLPKFSYF